MIKLLAFVTFLAVACHAQSYGKESYSSYTAPKPTYAAVETPLPAAPAPKYEAPAPRYEAPAPKYEAPAPPAPTYEAPAPKYEAPAPPAPTYEAPAPKYEAPAPPAPTYEAPAPKYEAPAPVVLEKPMASEYSAAPAPVVEKPAATEYSAPAAPVESYGNTRLGESILPEEAGVYSPEFNHMCKRVGLRGLTVFYKLHPTIQKNFIQCDDFGLAFLKTCPGETIFTENLTCEKIGELHAISRSTTEMRETGSSYGSASTPVEAPVEAPVETPIEAPLPVETAPIVEAPRPVASIASYGGETVNYGDSSLNRVAKVNAFMSSKY